MELSDRLKTLHQDQQLKVIERIFQKLLLAFGNQVQAKWQGIDMHDIYQDWAEALQDRSLGSIQHAIEVSKTYPHPPNQGEFLAHCGTYRPPLVELRLGHTISEADMESGRRKIREIAEMLAAKKKA